MERDSCSMGPSVMVFTLGALAGGFGGGVGGTSGVRNSDCWAEDEPADVVMVSPPSEAPPVAWSVAPLPVRPGVTSSITAILKF